MILWMMTDYQVACSILMFFFLIKKPQNSKKLKKKKERNRNFGFHSMRIDLDFFYPLMLGSAVLLETNSDFSQKMCIASLSMVLI